MSDDLPPQQEEAVRRLLADARETGPLPPDVAARLDAVIADLGARSTVTPLRRRRWPGVVLAAAAVTVVAGLGASQLVDRDGDAAQDEASAGGEAEVADGRATLREAAPSDDRAAGKGDAGADDAGPQELRGDGEPAVSLRELDRALRAEGLSPVGSLREAPHGLQVQAGELDHARTFPSTGYAGWGCGPLYAVPDGSTYTSTAPPGRLVVAHPPANGIRLVEVYDCRGAEPRRSTTVVTLPVER